MNVKVTRSALRSDLIEACHEPGCPVCGLGLRTAQNYLDITLYENANDTEVQVELRQARDCIERMAG